MTNNLTKKQMQIVKYVVFDSEDEIYNVFYSYGDAVEFYENIITFYNDREFYLYRVNHEPLRQTFRKYPITVKSDDAVLYD